MEKRKHRHVVEGKTKSFMMAKVETDVGIATAAMALLRKLRRKSSTARIANIPP
jgi:hypothetical protein